MATSANPSAVRVIEEPGFDTLSVTDMGDCIALAQVSEYGDLHDVQIGVEQARELVDILGQALHKGGGA
jgi:hypothetical protein